MKKVLRLLSVQLWAVLGDMLSISNSKKKKPKVLYVGVVFFTLLMSVISFFYSFMLGTNFKLYDSLDILPAMMMGVACVVILMTTIFKVKGTIFGFKDYDMVMSLPVSTGAIVACRLIILYIFNFLFVIILTIPMMIAYGILAKPSPLFYLNGFLAMLFIPLIPIVAASILGTLIAWIASKFRHNNLLNIIFSMGLLGIFIGLSFTIQDDGKALVDIGEKVTNQVNSIYPLATMYTDAVIHYDVTSLFMFIGISLGAFLIYTIIVKLVFKKINTQLMTGRAGVKFKLGELKTTSPVIALYGKEIRRYFASSLYVLNTGFGIAMLTFAAIASIFVDIQKVMGSPEAASMLIPNMPLIISFCVVMTCTSASSISLEGKSLWILKSMPIDPRTIYLAKIAVNLTIIAPAILDVIILGIVFDMGSMRILMLILVSAACGLFVSFLGLLMNILLPNFNWTSEVIVIKQSAPTMICVFTAMAYVGIQFALLFFIPSFFLATLAFLLLTVLIDIALYMLIMSYGRKRFYAF